MIPGDTLARWLKLLDGIEAAIKDVQTSDASESEAAALDLSEALKALRSPMHDAYRDAIAREVKESDGHDRKRGLLDRETTRIAVAREIALALDDDGFIGGSEFVRGRFCR